MSSIRRRRRRRRRVRLPAGRGKTRQCRLWKHAWQRPGKNRTDIVVFTATFTGKLPEGLLCTRVKTVRVYGDCSADAEKRSRGAGRENGFIRTSHRRRRFYFPSAANRREIIIIIPNPFGCYRSSGLYPCINLYTRVFFIFPIRIFFAGRPTRFFAVTRNNIKFPGLRRPPFNSFCPFARGFFFFFDFIHESKMTEKRPRVSIKL